MFDTIIIGSGISGLTAATALARGGQEVLLLEQHWAAGGLTQTFEREQWHFATGVHYLSGLGEGEGPEGQFRRLLGWLSAHALDFAPLANPYDLVRVGGETFGIAHPRLRYQADLIARFPDEKGAIEQWFRRADQAIAAAHALLLERGLPRSLAALVHLWRGREIAQFAGQTVAGALTYLRDPMLRTILGARGGDYGAVVVDAPFLEHALVTSAYDAGAWYPVGGPASFANALVPVIESLSGKVILRADVESIDLDAGRIAGVTYRGDGGRHQVRAPHVISTIGVLNTLERLPGGVAPEWRAEAGKLSPGPAPVTLYLGLDGDIAAAGATSANVWWYQGPDSIARLWERPDQEDAPALFVSFPSLKDPSHRGKPTAEVLALCSTSAFARWMNEDPAQRAVGYTEFKARVEQRLLAQFQREWPELAPMIAYHELSTPVSQRRFVRTPLGSTYGLEMSGQRLESSALTIRTPVPGLLLAGQDVTGAGIYPSAMSGMLAAIAIKPSLLRHLGG